MHSRELTGVVEDEEDEVQNQRSLKDGMESMHGDTQSQSSWAARPKTDPASNHVTYSWHACNVTFKMASWKKKTQEMRNQRDATLMKVEPPLEFPDGDLPLNVQELPQLLLTARENAITQEYSATTLLAQLREKHISVEEVTRAFLRRAAIAHHATNCLTELMWDEAIQRAKHLDSLPEPVGPLHGLPISVPESHGMHIYNKDVNAGYVSWIGSKSSPSPINRILYDAGCIFFARTNEAQALFGSDTNNNIYGRTVNPFNRDLSPGGSSGGAGALIGMRGSLLGIGNDISGGVRNSAGYNGLYSFRPTATKLGIAGAKTAMSGNEGIRATYGPISTDIEALELVMKTILDARPWRVETSLDVQPWRPHTPTQPLKIAMMWSDGVVKPHPPITRALSEVRDACKTAGMKVVDWRPKAHDRAWDIYVSCLYPDGGTAVRKPLEESAEPMLPGTDWMLEQPAMKERTMHEYWDCIAQRDAYRNFYASLWNDSSRGDSEGQEVDVIVCPVAATAAPLHDTAGYLAYTSHWNLLDYPAAVFPVTSVNPTVDKRDVGYMATNKQDRDNRDLWDPEKYADTPVGLQAVGRRGMDEEVLAALREIDTAIRRLRASL